MATSVGLDLEGSINKGSGEDFEISCEPCKDDGNFVESSGYCKNCDEYLCLACIKVHCIPKPCKHHVVLDEHQMPQNKPRKPKVTLCTVTCDKHPTECLKFFCKKHDITGCGDCMILDHKTCKVDYLSTLAESYNTSEEYTSIVQKVDELQAEVKDKHAEVGHSATKAKATVKKALVDIKQYRKDVNAYFDKVESNLVAKCNEIKAANQRESKTIDDDLRSLSKRVTSIHERLTKNIDNTADLFVRTKELRTILVTLEMEMKAVKKSEIQCIEFVKNAALIPERSSVNALGELQVSYLPVCTSVRRKRIMDMVPQHKKDISVMDSTDTGEWYISGMVHVRENIIARTDWGNNSVKLVDIKQDKVLSTVRVMDQSWDITSISQDTLAVTITFRSKIQFLTVKNDILSLKNAIDVNGKCRGIDCVDDKLVVSYDSKPAKVEIIDFHGNVLKVIQTDKTGTDLFKCPRYVVFSQDGRNIYVSDNIEFSVIKLTVDGTVQASYKDSDLNSPHGMFVCRDGSVLVCSSRSVHVISADCKKQKLLITKEVGVFLPSGISFDEDNGILCVLKYGMVTNSDVIQVYVMK